MGRPPRIAILPWIAILVAGAGCAAQRIDVNGVRARARVLHQVGAGPRVPGTPGHEAVLAWLGQELARLGARVETQAWEDSTFGPPVRLTNVIARYGPKTGRPIVLCAHWDTRPFADRDPDPSGRSQPVPGANDGASGVAVLLEVAERMSHATPPRPVELVFFDGEDQGAAESPDDFCLGSKRYAKSLAARPEEARPKAAFLFDMVGDRDLQIHPEVNSSRKAANLVAMVLDAARATGSSHFHEEPRYELIDDHVSLLEAGIPAVDVVDFDYAQWHTRGDLPDQVSAESLAEVARVAAWLVYRSSLTRS